MSPLWSKSSRTETLLAERCVETSTQRFEIDVQERAVFPYMACGTHAISAR